MGIWTRLTDRLGAWLDRRLARQWAELEAALTEQRAEAAKARPTLAEITLATEQLRAGIEAQKLTAETPWSHPRIEKGWR
jgi:hypothetical protein